MRHWVASLVALAGLTIGATCWAQPSDTDRSLAQSLFEQGKRLMESGNFEQACPKLAESQRLDPAGGTLLNLALCHERQGKIATAWTEFKEALGAAKQDARQDRIDAAQEHIAALEPKLPFLTLSVTSAAPGQEVHLDGNAIRQAAWGTPVAIDPGAHELKATAPGRKPWQGAFTVAVGERLTQTVPALDVQPDAPVAAATSSSPTQDQPKSAGSGSKTAGFIIGGVGVVALGVGTAFGIRALSKKADSDEECPTDTTCSEDGVTYNDQAKTAAWIANIGIGVGLVGIGVGTYLILTSGGREERSASSRPARRALAFDARVLPGGGEAVFSGTW
jgi:hypothetical protein